MTGTGYGSDRRLQIDELAGYGTTYRALNDLPDQCGIGYRKREETTQLTDGVFEHHAFVGSKWAGVAANLGRQLIAGAAKRFQGVSQESAPLAADEVGGDGLEEALFLCPDPGRLPRVRLNGEVGRSAGIRACELLMSWLIDELGRHRYLTLAVPS